MADETNLFRLLPAEQREAWLADMMAGGAWIRQNADGTVERIPRSEIYPDEPPTPTPA